MIHRIFFLVLGLILVIEVIFLIAHENSGWITPESAKKIKNPIKATKDSIQKGQEIYKNKCALCHGEKGDGKGPASQGLNPKPTNFQESHGRKMTDGEYFWKISTGRGGMPSFEKDLTAEEKWHVINYIIYIVLEKEGFEDLQDIIKILDSFEIVSKK